MSYDRGKRTDKGATLVCELYQRGEKAKETFVITLFHNIKMEEQKGKAKIHYQPLNLSLKRDVELRMYLVERIKPEPKPSRIFSLLAGAEVFTFGKPIKELKGVEIKAISDVLKVPVKAS